METEKKVLIVTPDVVGPVKNGGIGTACSEIARTLQKRGHTVSILFTLTKFITEEEIKRWTRYYKKHNVELLFLPVLNSVHNSPPRMAISYEVYRWLHEHGDHFDIIYTPEWQGVMFYSMLGKEQGLLLENTQVIVGIHSPSEWHREGSKEYPSYPEELFVSYMEKTVCQLADYIVSPSYYMALWVSERWGIDISRINVIKNPVPFNVKKHYNSTPSEKIRDIDHIIFFGRLEERKGIKLFCEAMALWEPTRSMQVTFLGKEQHIDGIRSKYYITEQAKRWDPKIQMSILTTMDQRAAIKFIKSGNTLVVLAPIMENSPYTLVESVGLGLPVLFPDVGGLTELVDDETIQTYIYPRNALGLVSKLNHLIGSVNNPPNYSTLPDDIEHEWDQYIRGMKKPVPLQENIAKPLVSVCMAHYNRPKLLEQAAQSIENQTYPNIELIVVDDASDPENVQRVREIKKKYPFMSVHYKSRNEYLGAARNKAINLAAGEYILIMDDDNVAKPEEIEVLVRAMRLTKADVLTVTMDMFIGKGQPESSESSGLGLFLGGYAAGGALRNIFGDANAMYRREVFDDFQYTTDRVGFEDWELFAKLALAGKVIMTVPEPLYYYRVQPGQSMLLTGDGFQNMNRAMRAYSGDLDQELFMYIHGLQLTNVIHAQIIQNMEAYIKELRSQI
ncbi:MAG: glycosyltransferase [Euryarchaeota archaeon]|nr:glycosyltransferase [Euryarchaeota archaeon]